MVIRSKLHPIPYGESDSAYPKNMNILDHIKTCFQKFWFPLRCVSSRAIKMSLAVSNCNSNIGVSKVFQLQYWKLLVDCWPGRTQPEFAVICQQGPPVPPPPSVLQILLQFLEVTCVVWLEHHHPVSEITEWILHFNPLTPNNHYSGCTGPLTSKRCILYIYSINIGTEYFKHGIYSPFFFSSKCSLFHNSNIFGSCFIHILYTGCAKI